MIAVKPQLVVQETAGTYNGDLANVSARIMRGSSWKKCRTILIVPASELIPAPVYLNHCSLIFPPNQGAHRMLAQGMEVGDAYSQAIELILSHPDLSQWEYVVTLEHDNLVPCDGIIQLMKRLDENPHLAAVSGLYFCKGEGGWAAPHIWGDPRDPVTNYRPQAPVPGQLVECCGLSMGFTLYRLGLFKDARLPRPLFRTKAGLEGVGTQDLAFWGEARKLGYRCAVDCGCLVGHLDFEGKFGEPGKVW